MTDTKRPTSPAAEEILGLYFPVLDHGFVSLVDYMGTDECIERAARVSYGYGTRKQSQTRGLLRYLRRHKHTTPSEMVELKYFVDDGVLAAVHIRKADVPNMSPAQIRQSMATVRTAIAQNPPVDALGGAHHSEGLRHRGSLTGILAYVEGVAHRPNRL